MSKRKVSVEDEIYAVFHVVWGGYFGYTDYDHREG